MATYCESLTTEQGIAALRVCEGLRIAQVWRSVDPCVFLEIGRLRRETLRLSNRLEPARSLHGQITCMIQSDWRVEKPRSIQSGSGFSDRQIDRVLKSLVGARIIAIGLSGRLPELRIELDDGRAIATFTNWSNRPQWSVGFKDTKLFQRRALPADTEISPWMHFHRGRLEIEYCYDDLVPAERQFFRRLGHA